MTKVYFLTVTDQADFGSVKCRQVYADEKTANFAGVEMVDLLVQKDTSGLGDTYEITVEAFEVFG